MILRIDAKISSMLGSPAFVVPLMPSPKPARSRVDLGQASYRQQMAATYPRNLAEALLHASPTRCNGD